METKEMKTGGYKYISGVMQYSGGVSALPGFQIVRVRFMQPIPMKAGFQKIGTHLQQIGRPKTAFCACELRSPRQFTQAGFEDFNRSYVNTLKDWQIMEGNDNPVARSNVCPVANTTDTPSFHAFCYTVEVEANEQSFVIAGSGEAPEGKGNYADVAVSYGDTSDSGISSKAEFVLGEMERRMSFFQSDWASITAVQLYTVYNAHHVIVKEMSERKVLEHGITWHKCQPPVIGLDFEMDCRRLFEEKVLL
jgi:hypothetical protein|tara:strand:- start:308 stop:1057 length:750 start_codon:yes stop_codon:yes gene_type:complete